MHIYKGCYNRRTEMSKLNRRKLQRMILQEFKMMGMADMQPMGKIGAFSRDPHGCDACGHSPCECDEHGHEMMPDMGEDSLMPMHTSSHTSMMGATSGKGQVSREDCCAAVMCLIECCSCPVTKQALMECCRDILAGDYDH